MDVRMAGMLLCLLLAAVLPAAAGQSNLACRQTPEVVKAGVRQGAAITCRLVNFNYTNITTVIWSFVSRSSAGNSTVILRGGERKSYYQAIHSEQFPTLDIGRITTDTFLYPSYNVTVMQEDVPVLKREFILRTAVLETTTASSTLLIPSTGATERMPHTGSQSLPEKSTEIFVTALPATEYPRTTGGTAVLMSSTAGDHLQSAPIVPQTPGTSRVLPSIGTDIPLPTILHPKASTLLTNYRTAEAQPITQSASRVPPNAEDRITPPPSSADGTSKDQLSFRCSQYPVTLTTGVGKDVAITCQLNAANWTNGSYVLWTFNSRSEKYGNRAVTLKGGERMYAVEAIKDEKFPTLFISRVNNDLVQNPDVKVSFYNGTHEVITTVYTTHFQGADSQGKQLSSTPVLSMSTAASAKIISTDWHSTLQMTGIWGSAAPQTGVTDHPDTYTTAVRSVPTPMTSRSPVSTAATTVSPISTNAFATETQAFVASFSGQTSEQPALSSQFALGKTSSNNQGTLATESSLPSNIKITAGTLSSSKVSGFSTMERTDSVLAYSPSASSNVMLGSTVEGTRSTADAITIMATSALSKFTTNIQTGSFFSSLISAGVTSSKRATSTPPALSTEAVVSSTSLLAVRTSEPALHTLSQSTATAASVAVADASPSSPVTNEPTFAVSTPVSVHNSSGAFSTPGTATLPLQSTTQLAVALATSSAADQQLSVETGTAFPDLSTYRSSTESTVITKLTSVTPKLLTSSSIHPSTTTEQFASATQSLLPSGEPLISSAAVHPVSTLGTQTILPSTQRSSAVSNVTGSAATTKLPELSSATTLQVLLARSSTTAYSESTQDRKNGNASSAQMPSGAISTLIPAANLTTAISFADASASSNLPTLPGRVSASQAITQRPSVSDSRTVTVGVLPSGLNATAIPTKDSSSPITQRPSLIETRTTAGVLPTSRQTTRGLKLPQGNYGSGSPSACLVSYVALVTSLLIHL